MKLKGRMGQNENFIQTGEFRISGAWKDLAQRGPELGLGYGKIQSQV